MFKFLDIVFVIECLDICWYGLLDQFFSPLSLPSSCRHERFCDVTHVGDSRNQKVPSSIGVAVVVFVEDDAGDTVVVVRHPPCCWWTTRTMLDVAAAVVGHVAVAAVWTITVTTRPHFVVAAVRVDDDDRRVGYDYPGHTVVGTYSILRYLAVTTVFRIEYSVAVALVAVSLVAMPDVRRLPSRRIRTTRAVASWPPFSTGTPTAVSRLPTTFDTRATHLHNNPVLLVTNNHCWWSFARRLPTSTTMTRIRNRYDPSRLTRVRAIDNSGGHSRSGYLSCCACLRPS